MDSDKSVIRTFGRKRKETAEDKFDEVFGKKALLKKGVDPLLHEKIKCSRLDMNHCQFFDNAVVEETKHDLSLAKPETKKLAALPEMKEMNQKSVGKEFFQKTLDKSKYDILFEKNEKRVSDKFDALFTNTKSKASSFIPENMSNSTTMKLETSTSSFTFPNWDNESSNEPSSNVNTKTSMNLNKDSSNATLPSITHASMMKVGGRVVLNIQRGGTSNSFREKGRTLYSKEPDSDFPFKVSNKTYDQQKLSCPINAKEVKIELKQLEKSDFIDQKSKCGNHSVVDSKGPTLHKNAKQYATEGILHRISVTESRQMKKMTRSKASYNARPWVQASRNPHQTSVKVSADCSQAPSHIQASDENKKTLDAPNLKRTVTWPQSLGGDIVTSIKCRKDHTELFTVVRHVKNYQNCLEEGEIKEFEDEVMYIKEGLTEGQPVSIRCLSLISLSWKCEQQNFRLFLRAHNFISEIFNLLQDAHQSPVLSLATSTLLYMLSRDRQIDINKPTLQILLKLLDPLDKAKPPHPSGKPESESSDEMNNILEKVKRLIDRCEDPLVTSKDFSTNILASEALLRFTARRTSEWYREEIRLKGGLDHIIGLVKLRVDSVESLSDMLPSLPTEISLRVLERLLKVLENGIAHSPRNAMYLVTHKRALLLKKLTILMNLCVKWMHQTTEAKYTISEQSATSVTLLLKNVIVQIAKLLVNISNDNEWSSTRIGEQDAFLPCVLNCILHIPSHVDAESRYEILMLNLGLMVNLVESSAKNRAELMKMKTKPLSHQGHNNNNNHHTVLAVDALVQLFVERESNARQNEILGEEGVKRTIEAKQGKLIKEKEIHKNFQPAIALNDNASEGYWIETDEGMEWAPSEIIEENSLQNSQNSISSLSSSQDIEAKLTVEQKKEMELALKKARDHMEASIVASYVALILGCLMQGRQCNVKIISALLPNEDIGPMIRMLKKFLTFMTLTHGMSKKGEAKLNQIIDEMEEVNVPT